MFYDPQINKIYFRDTGLLHSISRIMDFHQLQGHILVGASWEGYVIEEIIKHLSSSFQFFFYRTHTGAEADLVIVNSTGTRYCIEIKYSIAPVVSKGFYQCLEDLKPKQSYVIVPAGDRYVKDRGLVVINLREFVLEEIQKFFS